MTGYRGYIASRPIRGERTAQHVQNLVVRDYARRKGLTFLLSATEWAMPDCHRILNQVLEELDSIEGIIAFSIFMLPTDRHQRRKVWDLVLGSGRSFHGALEGLAVADERDVRRVEDIWLTETVLSRCPTGARPFLG